MQSKISQNIVSRYVHDAYCQNPEEYLNYRLENGTHAEDALIPIVRKAFWEFAGSKPTVLDLGCGFSSVFLNLPIAHYIGIDVSEELVKRHPMFGKENSQFYINDLRYCKFDKLSFNFVNGTLILNYLKHPNKLLRNVSRKGASFCFALPNPRFDQKYGELNGHGTIKLVLNKHEFIYYFHTIENIKSWFGNPDELKITFTPEIADGIPPIYVCYYGRW